MIAPKDDRRADLPALAEQYSNAATDGAMTRLAEQLSVSVESLRRLAIGWDGEAWTFPMRDVGGHVVGIRRRFPNGRKLSVKGGHEGLFIPSDLPSTGELFICEGPTDTAALLTLGFAALGRPSCTGGTRFVVRVARGRAVVIVADGDEPGIHGAMRLAEVLRCVCPSVSIIVPPEQFKDARHWIGAGATRTDIEFTIRNGPARHVHNVAPGSKGICQCRMILDVRR